MCEVRRLPFSNPCVSILNTEVGGVAAHAVVLVAEMCPTQVVQNTVHQSSIAIVFFWSISDFSVLVGFGECIAHMWFSGVREHPPHK